MNNNENRNKPVKHDKITTMKKKKITIKINLLKTMKIYKNDENTMKKSTNKVTMEEMKRIP